MALKLKRIVCALIAVLCVGAGGVDAKARGVQPNAIGARLTGIGGHIGELNYQRAASLLGSKRLEIGAWVWEGDYNSYWGHYAYRMGVAAVPQWHWNISPTAANGGFNWYAGGPGIGVGLHLYKDYYSVYEWVNNHNEYVRTDYRTKSDLYLGVGGQVGIEYDFNAVGTPINLSLDTRPMIDLLGNWDIYLWGICLAVRYTF